MGYSLLIRNRSDIVWEEGDIFKVLPKKWNLPLPDYAIKVKVVFGDIREAKQKLTRSVFNKYRRQYQIDLSALKIKKNKAWMWTLKNVIDKETRDGSDTD